MAEPPKRIQLSRKKGFKLPANTTVVSRPSRWGNPFAIGQPIFAFVGTAIILLEKNPDRASVVAHYQRLLEFHLVANPQIVRASLQALRGRNLACWCPLDQPCHADFLLKLANDNSRM